LEGGFKGHNKIVLAAKPSPLFLRQSSQKFLILKTVGRLKKFAKWRARKSPAGCEN
jgi:hypothetical protein